MTHPEEHNDDFLTPLLEVVRKSAGIDRLILEAVRERRGAVLAAKQTFHGVERSYNSGSIAHGTANKNADADGGWVLRAADYPELGPEGQGLGPRAVVDCAVAHLQVELQDQFPRVNVSAEGKRAVLVQFNEPVAEDYDPTVDLILALRRSAGGLWIPVLTTNSWDAANPIKHTELMTAPPGDLRVLRARAIRVAKAWEEQYEEPSLCSFHWTALALEAVKEVKPLGKTIIELFTHARGTLATGDTLDPAHVAPPIKMKTARGVVLDRVGNGLIAFHAASEARSADQAWRALRPHFPEYELSEGDLRKAGLAAHARTGTPSVAAAALGFAPVAERLQGVRSFGASE